ncbi:ABC transporter permease [Nocardiopsis sp. NPDC050513]|uniref:ABC transporter permease n=1 Tax=Nocardiopsis sp. NPDC050513 TaxID=3364338 RepID=UPI00379876D2
MGGKSVTRATGPETRRRGTPVRDTWVVFQRQAQPVLRRPAMLLFGMLQPVLYLALFSPLLDGLGGPAGEGSWRWFVPGLLVMLALFTSGFAGFGILPEMASGAYERMLVSPASRVSLLLGRVLRDVTLMLAQALLILVLVVAFGFRVAPLGAAAGLALLAVLGVGLATVSYLTAMAVRETYVFAPIINAVLMPLMLLSGVLLPMDLAPGWLYTLSRLNPVAHVVDAERALFAGEWGATAGVGWAVALGLAVVALAFGARATRWSAR